MTDPTDPVILEVLRKVLSHAPEHSAHASSPDACILDALRMTAFEYDIDFEAVGDSERHDEG